MTIVALAGADDFAGWRHAARSLALARVPPGEIEWRVGGGTPSGASELPTAAGELRVPRAFLTLAETAIRHEDPARFGLLYAMLLRLQARPHALEESGDALVRRLEAMARQVRAAAIGRKEGGAAFGPADMARPDHNVRAAWEALRVEATRCTRCHLYKHATQTVFGEGRLDARILFVGEQPGDQEDLAGRPFVGPAGQLFDRALADAGVDRAASYVTNAVKHFKFERRGKRRIHQKPEAPEIEACRWWFEQERALVAAPIVVALGATAARSIFGKVVTISRMRGEPHSLPGGEPGEAWVTVHPSFLLRVPEEDRRREEYARFVGDLKRIGKRASELS